MVKIKNKNNISAKSSNDNKLNNTNLDDAKMHQFFVDEKIHDRNQAKTIDSQNNVSITQKNEAKNDESKLAKNETVVNDITLQTKGVEKKNDDKSITLTNNTQNADKQYENASNEKDKEEDYKKIAELMQNHSLNEKTNLDSNSSAETDDEGVDIASALYQTYSIEAQKPKRTSKKKSKDDDKTTSAINDNEKVNKSAKPKKKVQKSFKQRMRTLGILIVLGIFTGSGLGVWYFNSVLRSNVNYNDYIISDYVVTPNTVLQEVYGISSNQENWLQVAKSSDKFDPSFLSPSQNFILAQYNASLADSFHAEGNGQVATIATQSVYSEKNYNGERYTFESISKGLMSIAICSAMDKGSNTVELYTGSDIQPDDAVWGEPEKYNSDDYVELAGSTPDAIQSYIISDKTILSQTEVLYDEETGFYSFTLELDPVTSVLQYARQVKQTSGLSTYPEFESVTQTITIDENWNLVSIDVHETYRVVAFGIPANCTGSLLTYYYFNVDDVVLPV